MAHTRVDSAELLSGPAAAVRPPKRPRRSGERSLPVRVANSGAVVKLVPAIAFLLLWELAANWQNSLLIPNASTTLRSVVEVLGTGETWSALWISNQALLLGFGAALLTGIPSGLLMGRVRAIEKMADVWINVLVVLPMAMLMPIIIMSLGFDLRARSLVVLLFAYPMVAVNSRAGVREVPVELIEMSRVFGANEREIWQKVLLYAAAPAIWTGIRIGLGRAITGMILGELLLVAVGIGRLLQLYKGSFEPANTYALVTIVVAESLLLMALVRRTERRMIPWAHTSVFTSS